MVFRTTVVLTLICISIAACRAQDRILKVLNYNALHGFSGDSTLKQRYIEWVKEINPDVVAYQEMNGYTQNEIGLLAQSYGHPYAVIMNHEYGVPVTHPLALTSKFPILNVQRVMDNMWHGYLYAYIEGIHMFVTHLAPFTLPDRQKDMKKILAQAALIPEDEPVLIAGDFNSLSPADSAQYGIKLLRSMQRIEGRLEPKSGTPIVRGRTIYRHNLNDGKIDYSVMQMIADAGYKDTYYLVNDRFRHTAPAKGHASKNSINRRIDYIWVNDQLATKTMGAEIIQDKITDNLSDHYPVLVKFRHQANQQKRRVK